MNKYRRTIAVMTLLLTFTITIVARNKRPENEYTNLKVYPKDVSPQRLEQDMHLFSASLNVECGYCHVGEGNKWNFASDEKHKKDEAREMMRMTGEINAKYFGADLAKDKPSDMAMNCFTCHRGEEQPVIPWDTTNIKAPKKEVPISPWGAFKH